MISIEFTKQRTGKTRDMQVALSTGTRPWVWSGKTVELSQADCTLLDHLILIESAKRTQWHNAAEIWQADLAHIRQITRAVARQGSHRFRNDSAKQKLFEDLLSDAGSRSAIYDQGLAARDAWETLDPAWTLSPDETLEAFGSLLASAAARQGAHGKKETEWHLSANALMMRAQTLDQECIAWYAEATRTFPEGTVEGNTIRETVPTTTRPDKALGQAVISHLVASRGEIHFDCFAPQARRYTYLQQTPTSPSFVVMAADALETSITLLGQPAGVHRFKAIGSNSRGESPESEVVEIRVSAKMSA